MAKPKVSSVFEQTMRAHVGTLNRLMDKRSVKGLKKLYDSSMNELEKKLAASMKAGKGTSMSVLQMRQLISQVREGQARISASLANGMKPILKDTQADAIRGASKTITKLEKQFTGAEIVLPLEEAATFAGLIQKRTPTLIRANASSWARYGASVTGKIEQELSLSLMTGETPTTAIDRVMAAANNQWWQAERIVRTETAYAFNASHADAIAVAGDELPDMMQRWTEFVDDVTGLPLDSRVAEDSLVLHGQVVHPGQQFVMPTDSRVSAKVWGKTYAQPPNRPNDRAILLPWRPSWNVPAWTMKNGVRTAMEKA
jgi:hypothetical protein